MPLLAAGPLARVAFAETEHSATHEGHDHMHAPEGHAAMIGNEAPSIARDPAIDALLVPPPPLPHKPGRVREYELVARDVEIEVAQGVTTRRGRITAPRPGQ